MIFDCLIDIKDIKDKQINSINLTRDWGSITKSFHNNQQSSLFGIIQEAYKDLRELSRNIWLNKNMTAMHLGV